MRYLSLFSFIAALILLASCHSSDVALRHSRIRSCHTEEMIALSSQKELIEDSASTNPSHLLAPFHTTIAPSEQMVLSIAQTKKSRPAAQLTPKTENNQYSTHPLSKKSKDAAVVQTSPRASTQLQSKPYNGVFGHIGHSFGVVGLVFIIVGVVLLLIGGLIIDTLGALAIAFGFVFILIWLVLAILQGLFDVIL